MQRGTAWSCRKPRPRHRSQHSLGTAPSTGTVTPAVVLTVKPSTKQPRTLSTTLVSVRDANYGTSAASLVLLASRHGARERASHRVQRRLAR
eukprot:scaffold68028_cov81-Phaeocystis_antarctica.AAC.1